MYKVECRKLIASPFFLLSVIALYFVILLGIRDFYPENEISSMLETGMGRIGLTSLPFLTTMPTAWFASEETIATVYKGNIIKNLIMDCQSYTKYRPNETTGGIFVSWRRKEELPTGA